MRLVVEVDGFVSGFSWSPDRTQFAYSTFDSFREEIYVADWPFGEPRLLAGAVDVRGSGEGFARPHWSPDGSMITYWASTDGGFVIFAIDLATGEIRKLTRPGRSGFQHQWFPCQPA
jgi:TolB protein